MNTLFERRGKVQSVRGGRRRLVAFSSLAVMGLGMLVGPATADDTNAIRVERKFGVNQPLTFVEDEFIVVLTRDARRGATAGVDRSALPTVNVPGLQDVLDGQGVTRFARQFLTAKPRAVGSKYPDLTGHYSVQIDGGMDLDTAMAGFARHPGVDHVEKIGIHPIYACATGTPLTPNDTWYDNPPETFPYPQWDLWDTHGIDAELAWDAETGAGSVVVVAMDTGVRYFHRDLGGNDPPGPDDNVTNGNVWVNPFEIPGNGIDDEGNGYIDDVVGWDFVSNPSFCSAGEDCATADNDPRDHHGHGTHTAGTMAAISNNARGVAGIAGGFGNGTTGSPGNGSKIMCLRIGYSSIFGGSVRMDWAAQAMNYVAEMKSRGVNVAAINCSWGSSDSGGLSAAVDNLLANDVMVIHAAGNDNSNVTDFLGGKAGVMNVAATDQAGNRAGFSNYGSWVDLAAPGVEIISTYHNNADPAGDYVAIMDGTSMAAPHAAGVAALLESCDAGLSGPDKFNIMVNRTCPAGSPNIGGILNAKLALDATACGGECTSDPDCDDSNVCNGLETCDLGSGICQPGTVLNCDDGDACTADSCDPAAGCANDVISCDDADTCTTDSCDPGSGCANDPIVCDDDDACTADSCSDGNCVFDPIGCDDGDACTIDGCDPALGCVSTPINCDDADFCTVDSCDPASGCVSDPIVCDDGDACTADSCSGGSCVFDPIVCDDGDACTIDSCDPASGCVNTPISCDDGDSCTVDSCDPGSGCVNDPIVCDDADSCTADSCDPAGGCVFDPIVPCCGDGVCAGTPDEDCSICPDDCISGTSSGAICGNGLCEAGDGEDCVSCPEDCNGKQNGKPSGRFCCGDGDGQNPLPCSDGLCSTGGWSCTNTPSGGGTYCCGDFVCEGDEDYINCDIDCEAPFCGDGTCDPGEDRCACPGDCGPPPTTESSCFDGVDNDCDGFIDGDDPDCDCGLKGDPCSSGADCCSGACKRNGTCR